jgi:hypothetical protein
MATRRSPYPSAYIELQVWSAGRLRDSSGLAGPEALLRYTNLYRILDLGRQPDPQHPVWCEFVDHIGGERLDAARAYAFYRDRLATAELNPDPSCFAYQYDPTNGTVRIHFYNREPGEPGPLSQVRINARRRELHAIFQRIRAEHPDAVRVIGRSWLYNRPSYLRLFPTTYQNSASVAPPVFYAGSLWGQFLTSERALRSDAAQIFQQRLARWSPTEDLAACFPYAVLAVSAPIADFYREYGCAQAL